MQHHCKFCGGFLKLCEEKLDKGRNFVCRCGKCGHTIKQFCSYYLVKGIVVSNKRAY